MEALACIPSAAQFCGVGRYSLSPAHPTPKTPECSLEQPGPRVVGEGIRTAGVEVDHGDAPVAGVIHDPFGPGSPLRCRGHEARAQRLTGEVCWIEPRALRVCIHHVGHGAVTHGGAEAAAAVDAAEDAPIGDRGGP